MPLPHDPLGIFSLFFDDLLVGMIVEKTNQYAEQSLRGTNKQWSTDTDEIREYMGFMILMDINYLPFTGPLTSCYGTLPYESAVTASRR